MDEVAEVFILRQYQSWTLVYAYLLPLGRKVTAMLPHLHEESEIKDAFNRMDHNGDGVIDLKDFLMWEERMQEGRANTDFFALQEVGLLLSLLL